MDKLYAATFGVFTSSSEEDLNDFINIVKSVISDDKKEKSRTNKFNIWIVLIFIIIVILLIFLYLKVYL
ncbi:IMV membrane protein [Yokapox virus]|uniref:IMV membrane protein n=1 Tax=Yokapox virus TaxID=1076255 RepID=G3EIC8_9POXV|nr:IMV membrane protein [Yokapox virus]AEN03639.1 IMV membrane protein [Yokapox virus]